MDERREKVVAAALSWRATPFHHEASVKGAGVDCGQLLFSVFREAGLSVPDAIPHYPPDFMLHRGDEWYLDTVRAFCDEIAEEEVLPADIVLWKQGRLFSHGAIVLAWPEIIHAFAMRGRVVRDNAAQSPQMRMRPMRFFRHRELA